jgi:diguanylate cyclase
MEKRLYPLTLLWLGLCLMVATCLLSAPSLAETKASQSLPDRHPNPDVQSELEQLRKTPVVIGIESDDLVSKLLFDSLSQAFNFEVSYRQYSSFDAILRAVEQEQVQFAANVTYSSDREQRFNFSPPSNIEYTFLYTRDGDSYQQMKTLGVPLNTSLKPLIEENFPDKHVTEYETVNDAIELLQSNQVDGIIDVINTLDVMLENDFFAELLNDKISIKPVSIISKKGKFGKLLKVFVTHSHADNFQKKLRNKISQHQTAIRVKSIRRFVKNSHIDTSHTFSVKMETLYPFTDHQPSGKVRGISADTLYQACDILNIDCDITSYKNEPWGLIYNDFLKRKIDIVTPVVISEKRLDTFYFSAPYYSATGVIARREHYREGAYSNISELISERVGAIEGDFYHALIQNSLPQKKFSLYGNLNDLIQALESGEIDYIPIDRSSLNMYLLNSRSLSIMEDPYIGEFHHSNVAFGFRKDPQGKDLARAFSMAINLIDTQKINSHYSKKVDFRKFLQQEKRHNDRLIILMSIIIAGVALIALYTNKQANTDSLSSLKNRRSLNLRYKQGISTEKSLLYIDINEFKGINDLYGHKAGDDVIKYYAKLIKQNCNGDIFRIGGDEFLIIGKYTLDELNKVGSILGELEIFIDHLKISIKVKASMGIFEKGIPGTTLKELMMLSDIAMYQAKQSENCDFVLIREDDVDELIDELTMRQELDKAVRQATLDHLFQPIMDIKTQTVVGIECLTYWRYKGKHLHYGEFEEEINALSLGSRIDLLALQKAEACWKQLDEAFNFSDSRSGSFQNTNNSNPFEICINLSSTSLRYPKEIISALNNTSIPTQHLTLEIIESYVLEESFAKLIAKLTDRGFKLVVDNFGATQSSINFLSSTPIKTVKIDRSLLLESRIHDNPSKAKAVISLLQALDKDIRIEGLELADQLPSLQQHNIHIAQGYLLSKPLSLADLISWINEHHY